jgi:hypothetical protein
MTSQEPSEPIRIRTQAELDEAMKNHVETVHFYDEETGELYEPEEPPDVEDKEGDEDSDLGVDEDVE